MLLQCVATESLIYAPLMGLFFGLAYLTKSFAFVVALLSIARDVLFNLWLQRRKPSASSQQPRSHFIVFGAVAGPYIAALSKQKHRFDFGDSGALNYAWYVSGIVKMHLEPSMTSTSAPPTSISSTPSSSSSPHPASTATAPNPTAPTPPGSTPPTSTSASSRTFNPPRV